MVAHVSLTGADLHESKGVASATNGQVYVANGSGSGTWTATPTFSNYTVTTAIYNLNKIYVQCYLPDVGSAGSATAWVVMPRAGTITGLWTATQKAAATANTTLTASIGGVNVTSGVVTIPFSGAAAGDVASATPSAANTVTAGQALKFTSNQGSTSVTPVMLTIELTASA
jgi:hypothetical protein